MNWNKICKLSDLTEGCGAAVLIGGQQIAVFLVEGKLFALSNLDPFTKQNVLSRGIVGSKNGKPKVASPLLKHGFYLETGEYTEDAAVSIATFQIKLEGGAVWVAQPAKTSQPEPVAA
jgi:nitrite reductase (NADH) small subunit